MAQCYHGSGSVKRVGRSHAQYGKEGPMLCGYLSCPLNARFKEGNGIGYCTVSEAVTIDQNGRCALLERLLKWLNDTTE